MDSRIRVSSVFDPWLQLHRSGHLALFCKTNPNDGRDQNRETSFFNWKLNISGWRGPGEKTCFYETNPNREIQGAWLQYVVKNTRRRDVAKRGQISQSETGPQKIRPNPGQSDLNSQARSLRYTDQIRVVPTRSDPIRIKLGGFDSMKPLAHCKCTMAAAHAVEAGGPWSARRAVGCSWTSPRVGTRPSSHPLGCGSAAPGSSMAARSVCFFTETIVDLRRVATYIRRLL